MYKLVGYMKTKYGYLGYFEQIAEREEQIHTGIEVKQAYITDKENEPKIGGCYLVKRYEKNGKEYGFLKK